MPWQEEAVTRNRDAGKALILLQKQNAALRSELGKLNEQLNELIYETQQKKVGKKVMPQTDTSKQELDNANMRLEVYTKELRKVRARYTKLQDPNYDIDLQQNISTMQAEVQEIEAWLKNAILLKAKRERVLDSVLETGETPEMVRAMSDAVSEFKVATAKNMLLERTWASDQKNFQENYQKTNTLKREADKLQAKLARLPPDPDKKLIAQIEEASKNRAGAEKQLYNVSAKLKVKQTAAEKRLAAIREQERSLADQLAQKQEALQVCSQELSSLHQTALPSKKSSKHTLPKMPESKGLFVTENQYSDRDADYFDEDLGS
jgi:predicted  nucleic acid-binding Zn-ribbon protein